MSEIIEGKPQIAPGFCFICEQSNDCRYIDTFRDFEGIVREKLDGRKYVCEPCIKEFAEKLGFVTPEVAAPFYTMIDAGNKRIAELEAELKKHEDLKAVLEAFGIEPKPKPKAAPKKPAAAKAA